MKKKDMYLILILIKLLYRNKRTKDILHLLFLSGIVVWGMFFYEFIYENKKFSYINSSFVTSLTVVSFIIPISFSCNIFSFYYSFLKSSFSTAYTEYQLIKSTILYLSISNIVFNLIFLTPLFYFNNELIYLLALVLIGNGLLIPFSMLISSVKISFIDLSKSKTYNYSGINIYIVLLTVLLLGGCCLLFFLSGIIFDEYVTLPIISGGISLIMLPIWVKITTYRLENIKFKFI